MTIQEAIDKAGPGGKIRKGKHGVVLMINDLEHTFIRYERTGCMGGIKWIPSVYSLIANDWEVIEPEPEQVIEVGDIVGDPSAGCMPHCTVIRIGYGAATLNREEGMVCACIRSYKALTLIRKGPKVIRIEGVKVNRFDFNPISERGPIYYPVSEGGEQVLEQFHLSHTGDMHKTYTLIMTEDSHESDNTR
jgi:hypothetical protein